MFFTLIFMFCSIALLIKLNDIIGTAIGFKKDIANVDDESVNADIAEEKNNDNDYVIKNIKDVYPDFNKKSFLAKSKKAFEIIFEAYASCDKSTLKPLLSPKMYAAFELAIIDREKKKEFLHGKIERIVSVELYESEVSNDKIYASVKFITEQVNYVSDENGNVIDGNPDFVDTITEIWRFSREIKSCDNKWYLSEITGISI